MRKFVLIALLAGRAAVADEVYRLVSDARYVKAGADGSVFVLSGKRVPTQGAWIRECTDLADSLTHVEAKTGAVIWSTCLPVKTESVSVDARGAVTIAGTMSSFAGVRATPGAYASPRGISGIAVIRLNPAASAPEWIATLTGDLSYPYSSARTWTAVGPDGSVYGAATVTEQNLPVSESALRTKGRGYFSGYFFRLSADGSKLLYATYVDGNDCFVSDLAVGGDGSVFVGGVRSSFFLDYEPPLATPGSFTTLRNMWMDSAWVARFDPDASGFRYVTVFGQIAGTSIALAPAGRGRVAIAATGISGVMTSTTGAYFADLGPNAGDAESFVLVLNPQGSAAEVVVRYGLGLVRSLEFDANGNLIVAGEAGLVPTTSDAWRLVGGAFHDSGFVLKLSADGKRVIYSTGIGCRSCTMQNVARDGDALWVAVSDKSENLTVGMPQPLTVQHAEPSVLRAVPDNWSEVTNFLGAILSWDTREAAVLSAEIRRDAPDGPLVARGTTGSIALAAKTATYYFVDTTGGGRRVLGVETFTRYMPLGGTPVDRGFGLSLSPNPVLSCRESPLTGTQTLIGAFLGYSDFAEVRVGTPAGPVVTSGFGPVWDSTGDWVRNGLSFFLADAYSRLYGSVRAYLLPNRSCMSEAPPEPMIRATRDCVQKDRFTLAWYSGTAPVEIREGSAMGPKVGRFKSDVGLLDVTAAAAKSFWLVSWQDGGWKPVASVVADPGASCGQGGVN